MTLPELQQHIVDVLNSRGWGMPFTAVRAYNPRILRSVKTPLRVFVIPREHSSEIHDETAWTASIGVDIGIAGKLPARAIHDGTEDVSDADPYFFLCAELVSYFKSADYTPPAGYRVDAVSNSPAYDPDALMDGLFMAPISLDLFGVVEEFDEDD